MPLHATPILLCLHLLAAALWVGGMATFHFSVRPAAVDTLEDMPADAVDKCIEFVRQKIAKTTGGTK